MKKKLLFVPTLLVSGFAAIALAGCGASSKADTANSVNLGGSGTVDDGARDNIQDGCILHAWDWSMDNITANMADIAAAGYTTIQTSPMQPQKDYYAGNKSNGNWWKLYQPLGFCVATKNNQIGTKEDLTEMCAEAEKYGIKVVVDVVSNHLAGAYSNGNTTIYSACQEYEPDIYGNGGTYSTGAKVHADSGTGANDSDAYWVTHGNIGSYPDIDTSSSEVQQSVLGLLKEYIDCGVDGFRFDAAKHIETPEDRDGVGSQYWNVVLNGATSYAQSTKGFTPYYYGEILNTVGNGRSYSWYTSRMSVTDNKTGNGILDAFESNDAAGAATSYFQTGCSADKIVLWGESHDTYANDDGESKYSSQYNVNKAYAMVASRAGAASLYFARPSEGALSTSSTVIGDVGTYSWKSTEIAAVNKFHNYFDGASEYLSSNNGYAMNVRYDDNKCGIVICQAGGNSYCSATVPSVMKDGTYKDQVSGNTFTVSNGVISGSMADCGIAVVYNATVDYTPSVSASLESGNIKTDSLSVTYTLKNSASAIVTVNGNSTTVTDDTATVNVSDLAVGDTVTVQIVVTGVDGTVITKSYTYTRVDKNPTVNVYFNNNYNWSQVNAYIWNETTGDKASAWPGTALTTTAKDSSGNTCYVASVDLDTYDHIIFNNGTEQTADISVTEANKEYALTGSATLNKYAVTTSDFVAYTEPDITTTVVTTTGSDDETTITVDFANDKNWNNVYAYVWNNSTQKSAAAWPGTKLTALGTDTNGYTAYSVTVNVSTYDRIIFNNGNSGTGNQTKDLTLTASTTGFTFSGAAYEFEEYEEPTPTTTITTTATTTTGSDDETTITVDFANDKSWSNVYAYVWNNSTKKSAAAWPGTKLTALGTDTNGYTAYSVTVDVSAYDRIIFNNGNSGTGNQTSDLTLTASTTGFTFSGAAYTFEEYVAPATQITVYFENTKGWSTVKAYMWNNSTKTNAAAWPGTAMTYVGKNSSGNSVYSITVDTAAYDRIIFTNGSGAQTVDLTVTASTTGFTVSGSQNNKLTCTSYSYTA